MKKILTITLISMLALFTACEGEVEENIVGTWNISKVNVGGTTITKDYLDTFLATIPDIDETMKEQIEAYQEASLQFNNDNTCIATFGIEILSGTYQLEGEEITLISINNDTIVLNLSTDTEPYEIQYDINLSDMDSLEIDYPIGEVSMYFVKQ